MGDVKTAYNSGAERDICKSANEEHHFWLILVVIRRWDENQHTSMCDILSVLNGALNRYSIPNVHVFVGRACLS